MFVKFRPDNFTDLRRTPWAGRRIALYLKSELGLELPERIGESWEFSASVEMPSLCADGAVFAQMLGKKGVAEIWLSAVHRAIWGYGVPLLIKYIDADRDLSLQLHPPLSAQLGEGDSGKWESWLVLAHEAGAGVYLGLKADVSRDAFERALLGDGEIRPMLHFVPVHTGEVIDIPPCTMHALGAGCCVLETQFMHPGRRAVSLRLHDWNYRYDAAGHPSPDGMPRTLHIDEALRYFDFDAPRGRDLEKLCRMRPEIVMQTDGLSVFRYRQRPWTDALVLMGNGEFVVPAPGELTFVTAMAGSAVLCVDGREIVLKAGESGAMAASVRHVVVRCCGAQVYMSHCLPGLHDGRVFYRT